MVRLNLFTKRLDLSVNITLPTNYAGSYLLDSVALAALPHNMVPPQISGTAQVGSDLTGVQGAWVVDPVASDVQVFDWRKDGASAGSATLTYSVGATGDYSLRETVGAEFVESNVISVIGLDTWDLTSVGGGVVVNAKPTPPAAPIIASTGNTTVTIG
jgi:hypothetical protein